LTTSPLAIEADISTYSFDLTISASLPADSPILFEAAYARSCAGILSGDAAAIFHAGHSRPARSASEFRSDRLTQHRIGRECRRHRTSTRRRPAHTGRTSPRARRGRSGTTGGKTGRTARWKSGGRTTHRRPSHHRGSAWTSVRLIRDHDVHLRRAARTVEALLGATAFHRCAAIGEFQSCFLRCRERPARSTLDRLGRFFDDRAAAKAANAGFLFNTRRLAKWVHGCWSQKSRTLRGLLRFDTYAQAMNVWRVRTIRSLDGKVVW
jgi:hypothetical protein